MGGLRFWPYFFVAAWLAGCSEDRPDFGDDVDGDPSASQETPGAGGSGGSTDSSSSPVSNTADPEGTTPNAVGGSGGDSSDGDPPGNAGGPGATPPGPSAPVDTAMMMGPGGIPGPGSTPVGPDPAPDPGPVETLLAIGEACGSGAECADGNCADGVCCESACDDVCSECAAPGTEGTCIQADEDPLCTPPACPDSTECLTVTAVAEPTCLSVGACRTEAACLEEPAAGGTPCQSGEGMCDGSGECVVPDKLMLGQECTSGDECGSTFCAATADGGSVCCDSACEGTCEACSATGKCDAAPADDTDCATVTCSANTACTNYPAPRQTDRCVAFRQCITAEVHCQPQHASSGTGCGEGLACDGSGMCSSLCTGTQSWCGLCTNTDVDNNHCGECGNACTGGQVCSGGSCSCPSGNPPCDGQCLAPGQCCSNLDCGAGTGCNTTTHACVDNVAPSVTAIDPSNNADSVQADKTVVILFSEPMNTSSVASALSIAGETFTTLWSDNNKRLEIKGNPGWTYARGTSTSSVTPRNIAIAISTAAKDVSGNSLAAFNSSFTTKRLIDIAVTPSKAVGVIDPASTGTCSSTVSLSSSNVIGLVFGSNLTRTPDADAFDLETATLRVGGSASSGTLRVERISYSPTNQTSWITNARQAGPVNFAAPSGGSFSADVTAIVYDGWINGTTPNMFRLFTTGSISANCAAVTLDLLYLVH